MDETGTRRAKVRQAAPGAAARPRRRAKSEVKTINLALQGGGAHGAFTWGALDRLLEEERLVLEGISGTSAGAMNAAVLADGYAKGGRDGARAALDRFWHGVAKLGRFSPLRGPLDLLSEALHIDPGPGYFFFDAVTRLVSPYQTNPFNWNPLRDVLAEQIDFAALHAGSAIKLFVSATNVRSGKNRVFHCGELSVDALLASACLPHLFQAVEIDGEHYWDGGYMGNPAIYPLIYECSAPDVAIIQVNPINRAEVPRTAPEILDRLNEISFNSTMMRELRAVAFVTKLIDDGDLSGRKYKRMYMHLIGDETEMSGLGVASKLNADLKFLLHLRDIGRAAAERWLVSHFDAIGKASSIDLDGRFL